MKSILISSDFVYDSNGNIRLLEINTNTGVLPTQLEYFNFLSLKSYLLENGYTKLVFVYNNNLNYFVNYLQDNWSADESVSGITLELVKVFDTFYGIPDDIVDNATTFIVRTVYDSTAIVDSEYCANEINLYDLFINNNDTGSIPNLKFKREDTTEFDNLLRTSNSQSNIPDYFFKKSVFSPYINNKLVKLQNGVTIDDLLEGDSTILDTYIVENYHYNETDSLYNNKIQAIRAYQLWYGSNLDAIDLAFIDSSTLTSLPTESDFSVIGSYVDKKWRYSYITNFLTAHDGPKQHGYREDSLVELMDNSQKQLKDVVVGDVVKSYIVTSLPDASVNTYNWFEWKQTKAEYDLLNKYETTSSVMQIDSVQLNDFAVELLLEGSIKYYSLFGSGILTWQSNTDAVLFISATTITPGDRLITSTGNGLLVEEMNVVYDTGSYFSFDIEESDTVILKPADIIVHNYECFAAGTKVLLVDGSTKNIEDVQSGDIVVSYNLSTNENENKVVGRLLSILSDHISYVSLSNGTTLRVTNDHPIYTNKGWAAIDVELTKTKYDLPVEELVISSIVKTIDGNVEVISIETKDESTMTFTLKDVEDNGNFYADGVLVHNRPMICFVAGTQITLSDNSLKNIEDVIVGENVLTYNVETGFNETGVVGDLKKHEVSSIIKLTFDGEKTIITTTEHPFFVKEKGWVKANELQSNDICRTDLLEDIKIVSVEILEETHTVYNLLSVSNNHNFYANNILVHNK